MEKGVGGNVIWGGGGGGRLVWGGVLVCGTPLFGGGRTQFSMRVES